MIEKQKNFLECLSRSMGIVTTACENSSVSRSAYYRWLKTDAEFAEACEEIKERQVDFVENALMRKVNEGDTTAIIFYLKTRGKHRGYSERKSQKTDGSVVYRGMIDVEARVVKTRERIVAALQGDRRYNQWLDTQISLAARLVVRSEQLWEELQSQPATLEEVSREGDTRVTVNPLQRLYNEAEARAQSALKACGLNADAKHASPEPDTVEDFMKSVMDEQ